MIQIGLTLLIVLHLAWHVIAGIGVAFSLIHSDRVHKHKVWKLVAAGIWLAISVALIAVEVMGIK